MNLQALRQALVDIATGVITRTLAVQGRIEAGITWLSMPSVQRVSAPDRVIYEEGWREQIEEHERKQPRVGFAPPPVVTEPLLWDGDYA